MKKILFFALTLISISARSQVWTGNDVIIRKTLKLNGGRADTISSDTTNFSKRSKTLFTGTAISKYLNSILSGGTAWGIAGSSGTNPSTNFIGTTDNVDLIVKVNNSETTRFKPGGNVGIGTNSPAFKLDVNGKIGIVGKQLAYLPDQVTFPSSFAIGTGLQQLVHTSGNEGIGNFTLGLNAGDSITKGYFNLIGGGGAGASLRDGFFNTIYGIAAGAKGQHYTENVYLGLNVGNKNRGFYNTVAGTTALYNCDSCETLAIYGANAARSAITANQSTVVGYRAADNSRDIHFSNLIGYRLGEFADTLFGVTAIGQNVLSSSITKAYFHTVYGAFGAKSLSGNAGRYSSYFGAYSGTNANQKAQPINQFAIGAFSYATKDYEGVIGSDSTKYLKLRASDSVWVDLPRITNFNYVHVYDSISRKWGYMPISMLPSGGGGGGISGSTGSTDNRILRADGTGGSILQAGAPATLADDGTATFNGVSIGTYGGSTGISKTGTDFYFVTSAGALIFNAGSAGMRVEISGGGAYSQHGLQYGGNYGYLRMGSNFQILGSAGYTGIGNAGTPDHLVVKDGSIGIGTTSPTTYLDINGNKFRVRTAKTPSSANDTGDTGDICWDSNYIYIGVGTNSWKRVAISAW